MKGKIKSKFPVKLMTITTVLACLVGLTGCNNQIIGGDIKNYTYVVIEENGNSVLHEVNSWGLIDADVTINTKCCDTDILTHPSNTVLYSKKPAESKYDTKCEEFGN